MSTSTNRLLVTVAAAAATGALFAQPALEPASIDPKEQLLEQIAELRNGARPAGRDGGRIAELARRLRSEVLMYYADAIEVILRAGDYADQELGELEYLALEILDSCLAPVGRAHNFVYPNVGAEAGLIRLLSYEIRSGAPAAARANAIAELADWFPRRAHNDHRSSSAWDEKALAFYELAYHELRRGNDAPASTTQIFAPEIPLTLPTYEPNPLASAATAESPRYIDVAFAVTKNGRAERIEILDTGPGTTRAEERDLIRLIEGTTFRPRIVDGEIAASAPVALRYYLSP